MKKFFYRYTELTICCGIASTIVIFYIIVNIFGFFPEMQQILDVVFQISVGYIINFIFFTKKCLHSTNQYGGSFTKRMQTRN